MKQHSCAAMAAALILVGCQGDVRVPATPAFDTLRMSEAANDSLRLTMELPARVRVGEPIAIVLRAINVSGGSLELYLHGREPTADVLVHTSSHVQLWHRLSSVGVQSILRLEPLAAGDSLVVRVTWDQRNDDGAPVPPGVYQVSARILAEDPDALRFPPTWVQIVP